MQEDFIYYLWKYRLFKTESLYTTCDEEVSIIHPGFLNSDSGADFKNAKIKIGGTFWVGNVEIHNKASDWYKHQHQKNKAYDNVILHVVWENDADIYRTDNSLLPAITLKDRVKLEIIHNYEYLKLNKHWIPCEKQINDVDYFYKKQWLNRVLIERLESKSKEITEIFEHSGRNWEETCYILLAKSFGFKVNSQPFQILAQSLPQIILAKHKNNALQIEALIFGQAGFLNSDFQDDYPNSLKNEYMFLKQKYGLNTMDYEAWKFSRMRPSNFPSIRLAQFASLVSISNHLFSKFTEEKSYKEIYDLFNNCFINSYWESHYLFDIPAIKFNKKLGKSAINSLIINGICNLLFTYGKYIGDEKFVQMAFTLLDELPYEDNKIVENFKRLGFEINSAFDSQAVLQLKYFYCDLKKCLNCEIGNKILNR